MYIDDFFCNLINFMSTDKIFLLFLKSSLYPILINILLIKHQNS